MNPDATQWNQPAQEMLALVEAAMNGRNGYSFDDMTLAQGLLVVASKEVLSEESRAILCNTIAELCSRADEYGSTEQFVERVRSAVMNIHHPRNPEK